MPGFRLVFNDQQFHGQLLAAGDDGALYRGCQAKGAT